MGEEAKGKPGSKSSPVLCDPKTKPSFVIKSDEGVALGDSHIAITGHWETSQTGPDGKRSTSQLCATEVIVKTPTG